MALVVQRPVDVKPSRRRTRRIAIGVAMVVLALGAQRAWATAWTVGLAANRHGETHAGGAPTAPSGVSSTCTSALATTVTVTWNAVANATSYSVYDSTTSAPPPRIGPYVPTNVYTCVLRCCHDEEAT